MKDPIVKGGQGRSAEEVQESSAITFWAMIATAGVFWLIVGFA